VLLTAAGCASREHAKESGPHTTHWSYSGATGPAYWGSLSPEYALCSTGRSQSPIDIAAVSPRDLPNIAFNYQPSPMSIINNGHTVQVNYAPGSFIILDGERFDLAQFHFHAPSEHTIKGTHAAAEMHLVHKSASGGLAVVGVMLREGAANPMFESIAANMPESGQKIEKPEISVNAAALLPADARTYRYSGSLTTPPGTEGVKWNLMLEPVTVSSSQLASFRRRYDGNNRPIQKLNGREIIEDTTR
jgi:carbonic anhydrase